MSLFQKVRKQRAYQLKSTIYNYNNKELRSTMPLNILVQTPPAVTLDNRFTYTNGKIVKDPELIFQSVNAFTRYTCNEVTIHGQLPE